MKRLIEYIGGSWWRCLLCNRTIKADCECCEPPKCKCTQTLKGWG